MALYAFACTENVIRGFLRCRERTPPPSEAPRISAAP